MFRNKLKKLILIIVIPIIFTLSNPLFATNISGTNPGDKAPEFTLQGYNPITPNKSEWSLNDYNNKWIILYFYPKDMTSGCTIEAKGFQRLSTQFRNLNASIVGISNDSKSSHKDFCSSKGIDFTLLSDEDGRISNLYDSWRSSFSNRNTYLIDPEGRIAFKWTGVKPTSHPKEVLEKLIEIINT